MRVDEIQALGIANHYKSDHLCYQSGRARRRCAVAVKMIVPPTAAVNASADVPHKDARRMRQSARAAVMKPTAAEMI